MNKIINFITGDKSKKEYYNQNYNQKYNEKYNEMTLLELMHDLKTPIISTIGFLQLLDSNNQEIKKNIEYQKINKNINLDSSSDNDSDSSLDSNLNNNSTISTINILNENQDFINEALENLETFLKKLSQISNSSNICYLEKYSLKNIVDNIIKILKPLIIQNNIEIINNISNEHYILSDLKEQYNKIIIHLIENAIKYNYYGGFIEIESQIILNNNQNELVITIIDSGIGFSKEQLRKINSLYIDNQFNTEIEIKDKYSFGVGLTIVKKIINNLNGKMIINSQKNKGTTIQLFFPYNI